MIRATTMAGVLVAVTGILACAQPTMVIKTETRLVEVDVVATDKQGNYVPNLQAKDFHVWEDNKEQAIQNFSFRPTTEQEQFLILFFDGPHLGTTEFAHARQAAMQFIQAIAGPHRQMAVIVFDNGLRVVQSFTGNAETLTGAVKSLSASSVPSVRESELANPLFGSLTRLTIELGSVRGRKALVWFSGAFAASGNTEINTLLSALNRSNTGVYPVDLAGWEGGMDVTSSPNPGSVAQLSQEAIRGRSTARAQATDAPAPATSNGQILGTIADKTGGFMVKDLVAGLSKVATEQAELYVLGYTPPSSAEGSCHAIRVKVDRAGTNLRARDQYCNARPADLLAGSPVEKELEDRAAGTKEGNLAAELQLPFFYTSENKARVNAAMEIPLTNVKFEKQQGRLHAELHILGTATVADGSVRARFSDTVKLDFDGQSAADRSYHYETQFDIAPGEYNFEVVFSTGRDSFGKRKMPLVVEPRQPSQFGMSALALSAQFKPATKSNLVAEGILFEDKRRLVSNGVEVVPSGSTRFAKDRLVAFYCEIYEPLLITPDPKSATTVAVQVTVFDRQTGDKKSDSGMLRVELPTDTSSPVVSLAMKIPTDNLPAGAYRVEVVVTDNASRSSKRTANLELQ